jgi:hypothetical protein
MTKPGRAGEWQKSSHSGGEGQDCVEVRLGHVVDVRDTKNREGGQLTVSSAAWAGLLEKTGRE